MSSRLAIGLCALVVVSLFVVSPRALGQGRMPAIGNGRQAVDDGGRLPFADRLAAGDLDTEAVLAQDEAALGPELFQLREQIRRAIALYYPRHLNSRDHNPWEVMHQIVAFGVNTMMHRGGPDGESVNAIAYVCWNGPCAGRRLLESHGNRISAAKGPSVQGHHGQFVGMLAQSRVPIDYPLRNGNQSFTVGDLVETEKLTCRSGEELTFKLIAISHYCDLDTKWVNDQGQKWDIPRVLREEINAPVKRTVTCGGTHRLFSVAYPVRRLIRQGDPIEGEFRRAQIHTQNYIKYALKIQNSDGSLSTEWFEGRGSNPDLDRRIKTSGHIFEWLAFAVDDDQLADPRVMKAANYLSKMLLENRSRQWEIGPLGHALHALVIYEDRLSNLASPPQPEAPVITETEPDGSSSARRTPEEITLDDLFSTEDDAMDLDAAVDAVDEGPAMRTAEREKRSGETARPRSSVSGPVLVLP